MERNKYFRVLLSTSKLFPSHEMFIFLTHPMIDWCQETNNIMNKKNTTSAQQMDHWVYYRSATAEERKRQMINLCFKI